MLVLPKVVVVYEFKITPIQMLIIFVWNYANKQKKKKKVKSFGKKKLQGDTILTRYLSLVNQSLIKTV